MMLTVVLVLATSLGALPLGPGTHTRALRVEGRDRSYVVHVPPKYDAQRPAPVVLVFHGAAMNARITMLAGGMVRKSDEAGFIAVYPNGTGVGPFLSWNAGEKCGRWAEGAPDDVKFVSRVLDDLATVVNVDAKRVYAAGMSNGGMMCYRLASELPDRIAAIAAVAGTMAVEAGKARRAVPVMHFHGTADGIVPLGGSGRNSGGLIHFKSVEETIRIWCRINACPETPAITEMPDTVEDGTKVRRKMYGPGKDGAEVVLYEIIEGEHTWPGEHPPFKFLGKSTFDISATDLIWEFFEKHPKE